MVRVLGFGPDDLTDVGRLSNKFADQKLPLTDAHDLAFMRDRHIKLACPPTATLTGATLVI